LKDIARDLGVSIMTVSKALRGHADIGEETRRLVLERARQLKYQPNLLPRQMLSGRTHTLGMIVPTLESTYFSKLVQGVTVQTRERGYQLLLCNSDGIVERERGQIQALLGHRVDGIVLAPAGPLRKKGEMELLFDSNLPFVLAGRGMPGFEANFVGSDGVGIGRTATKHLIQRGCRRIAHIQGPPVAGSVQRREGFLAAMKSAGYRIPSAFLAGGADGIEVGYDAMRVLLRGKSLPDGVFCYTDMIAAGAMQAILDAALNIPKDIALIGVGNLLFSDLLKVPLTTIDQNPVAMGGEAAELILDLAEERLVGTPVRRFIPFRLLVRQSSSRPQVSASDTDAEAGANSSP
jgi:LacI family transcriptional regulator